MIILPIGSTNEKNTFFTLRTSTILERKDMESCKVMSDRLTIWTRNSVFIRRVLSSSFSDRSWRRESTSSIKITAGCRERATAKRARTSFSLSPCHLEVNDDEETLKNVAFDWLATHLPISVLPVPTKCVLSCRDSPESLYLGVQTVIDLWVVFVNQWRYLVVALAKQRFQWSIVLHLLNQQYRSTSLSDSVPWSMFKIVSRG